MAAAVELFGGDAGHDVFLDHFQHLGGEAAGDAHLGDVLVVLEFDGHTVGDEAVQRVHGAGKPP